MSSIVEVKGKLYDELYREIKWVDNSIMTCFSRCPRKCFYQYRCGLVTPSPRVPMLYGECFHSGTEGGIEGNLVKAMALFAENWDEGLGDDQRCLATMNKIMSHFIQFHAQDNCLITFETPQIEDMPRVAGISKYEIPFVLDLGLPWVAVGRIDALARHKISGGLWPVEFKTASRMDGRLIGGQAINPQALLYSIAGSIYLGEIEGVFFEFVGTARIKRDIQIQPIYISDELRDLHLRNMQDICQRMVVCQANKEWPADTTACNSYPQHGIPGYVCEYQNLCLYGNWEQFANAYKVEYWSPFPLEDLVSTGGPV